MFSLEFGFAGVANGVKAGVIRGGHFGRGVTRSPECAASRRASGEQGFPSGKDSQNATGAEGDHFRLLSIGGHEDSDSKVRVLTVTRHRGRSLADDSALADGGGGAGREGGGGGGGHMDFSLV